MLATPSFTPGPDESPFVTWGDLEGTPLRLDPADDIAVDPSAAAGPQFHVPEVRACRPFYPLLCSSHAPWARSYDNILLL